MSKKINIRRRKYVGELLLVERKSLGLNQEELAQKLGVNQELISKIEAGKRRIDSIQLIEYCEALSLTPTEFAAKIETRLYSEGLLKRPENWGQKVSRTIEKIRVNVSWLENHFSASIGENLPLSAIFTADTFGELQEKTKEGFDLYIERILANDDKVPQWLVNKSYDFEYKFTDVTSLLKAYTPYLTLASISRATGINENLLSQYANGYRKAHFYQMKRILDGIHKISKELMIGTI